MGQYVMVGISASASVLLVFSFCPHARAAMDSNNRKSLAMEKPVMMEWIAVLYKTMVVTTAATTTGLPNEV
jgi:uncharacterized membrane-anchored protein